MNDETCPFCGSKTLKIPTPYIKPVTHEVITTACCKAQAKNQEYIRLHSDPTKKYYTKLTNEDVSHI